MTEQAAELMGLNALSRDGGRLGKVAAVIGDEGGVFGDCLVIKRSLLGRLVVPADVVTRNDGTVVVPFATSFLDAAPKVAAKGSLSAAERSRLERFFHPGA